jgi:type II secretory pathway pseudopilin PulG
MMWPAAARRRVERPRASGDGGITLIEVVVSMTVMTALMSIFTFGVVQMYRSANKVEAVSVAQSQMHTAFQRLDREIRYASGISTPAQVGPDWYVEYLTANGGGPVCVQLRLVGDTRQLQRRTWPSGSTPGTWGVLASDVGSGQPFEFSHNGNFQRLRLHLVSASGPPGDPVKAETNVTFTALNTLRDTTNHDVCSEGRPS